MLEIDWKWENQSKGRRKRGRRWDAFYCYQRGWEGEI